MSYNTYTVLKARRAVLTEMLAEDGFLSDDLTVELYNIQGELNKDLVLI
jgi:glycine cleavage system aminomethyltransferase T